MNCVCRWTEESLSLNKIQGQKSDVNNAGKGHYYENHNVENQKEHWKICKPSLHRKSLFSWSLLRHHYGITTLQMAF